MALPKDRHDPKRSLDRVKAGHTSRGQGAKARHIRDRSKGAKARLDELEAARRRFFQYLDMVEEDKATREKGRWGLSFRKWHREWLGVWRQKYLTLLAACKRDGLVQGDNQRGQ